MFSQSTILANLRDPDVSIRRRALDLLFTMCDGGAAVEVVEELVSGTAAAACISQTIAAQGAAQNRRGRQSRTARGMLQ
jgi:hypothetical protein